MQSLFKVQSGAHSVDDSARVQAEGPAAKQELRWLWLCTARALPCSSRGFASLLGARGIFRVHPGFMLSAAILEFAIGPGTSKRFPLQSMLVWPTMWWLIGEREQGQKSKTNLQL